MAEDPFRFGAMGAAALELYLAGAFDADTAVGYRIEQAPEQRIDLKDSTGETGIGGQL